PAKLVVERTVDVTWVVPVEEVDRLEAAERGAAGSTSQVRHVSLALLERYELFARLDWRGARLGALLEQGADGFLRRTEAHRTQGLNDVAWTFHRSPPARGE